MTGRLIAVMSCHRFRGRADAIRETWLRDVEGFDVRFFLGSGGDREREDEVILDVPDDYVSLRRKVQEALGWAVSRGYERVFKTDDDVYVIPARLAAQATGHHYQGRVRAPSRENDAPRIYGQSESNFCSGFGYWVSAHAARLVAAAPDNGDWAEDRFAGNALARQGIRPLDDNTILLWPPLSGHLCHVPNGRCRACIQQYARASVICPHQRPDMIRRMHRHWKEEGFIPTYEEPC